jgi:hypothetical protein
MMSRCRYRSRRGRHGFVHVSRVLPEIFERIHPDRVDGTPQEQRELFEDDPDATTPTAPGP